MQSPSFAEAIERIVELSADLQIRRRATSKYSLAFHDLSVAIGAYGEALAALTALQQQQEEDSANVGVVCSRSLESWREAAS